MTAYNKNVDEYIREFKSCHTVNEIIRCLDDLRSLKVVVIGETILDEYVYGDILGKSAKEPILVLRHLSEETHAGGAAMVANHLSSFCDQVELVTYLGEENSREDFIRSSLHETVKPFFIQKSNSPTIVKRRFVDKYLVTKLLEVYEINDAPMAENEEEALCAVLRERLAECDVVIAADYGHGLLTPRVIDFICQHARFLSVNTQINAANHGFHTLSRYPRADYVCVHEGEVRLDQRDRTGQLDDLVKNVSERMDCKSVLVTQGKFGTLLFRPDDGFTQCPALAMKVTDRVGAGDSVLAVSSLCVQRNLPSDIVGFISNMVGAQAVTIVGNRDPIDRESLYQAIKEFLQ
ncbi:MAG: bifunctional ADP-heptose synthase [Candidatus Hinthialibacter antarcticus]|nr:bifunctional ADP-heptose synthase [Candidatus Hinthialibacter antarcticus]